VKTTTTQDGIRIAYEELGHGEPALLFLTGWCADRTAFQDVPERLSGRGRVLVLDWRGHGESERPAADFGAGELVQDAMAVMQASGTREVIPVALSHAGWVALDLRRRLGARVPKLVLLDWIVTEAPPPFLQALRGMQSPARWRATVDAIFGLWLHGVANAKVNAFVREGMGSYGFDMWSRAAREITAAYAKAGSPLKALAGLDPPVSALHLYAQPDDPEYLAAQRQFAAEHRWFQVRKLHARTHFPMFEVPADMAAAIESFLTAG
jgi:pimeloyl-ACP methyl ester carboxylesterase